jgi:hypothetical protein
MTVKRKRFKSHAEAEQAALRCEAQVVRYARAMQAVVTGKVHWLERDCPRGQFRAGLCWPASASGGIVILVQVFPTNTVHDVMDVDVFLECWSRPVTRSAEELVLRNLVMEVAALRRVLLGEKEGTCNS